LRWSQRYPKLVFHVQEALRTELGWCAPWWRGRGRLKKRWWLLHG